MGNAIKTLSFLVALGLVGCDDTERHRCTGPSCPTAAMRADDAAQEADLRRRIAATSTLSAAELITSRQVPFAAAVPRNLSAVAGYSLIQQTYLAPTPSEEHNLTTQGFSISDSVNLGTFTNGYIEIYRLDLPIYISADSILHAVHRGYDTSLERLERFELSPAVGELLASMRSALGAGGAPWLSAERRGQLDLYLTVGASLLADKPLEPVAGASAIEVQNIFARAHLGVGRGRLTLFGSPADVDFSQFKPRGHYEDTLAPYFRAMMWFGRTEFTLVESSSPGVSTLRRAPLEAAVGLVGLMSEDDRRRFDGVETAVRAFVGDADSMTVPQVESLLRDLGLSEGAGLAAVDDKALLDAIVAGRYGFQRIASQLIVNGTGKTLPLARAFQLFGQRYILDSHVLSNVVYDRVQGGAVRRMMPSPLDVAYAALGNDQAASLLEAELTRYPYAPDLEAMRILTDAHEPAYWESSLYALWLSSLRSLSPAAIRRRDAPPPFAATEAWGRRLLGTQMASWAELRHDTVLYAKQSYGYLPGCEYPDAYVDPYPEFYEALMRYAELGQSIFKDKPMLAADRGHFSALRDVSSKLRDMAEAQRAGVPFTTEQMAFVNDAVTLRTEISGCAEVTYASGWYPNLFAYGLFESLRYKPTIVDVHTQPADEAGNEVGKVLHVGTDGPRPMIVIADTCTGPRAYVGLASSYHELITDNYQRIADKEWATMQKPPPPPWLSSLSKP